MVAEELAEEGERRADNNEICFDVPATNRHGELLLLEKMGRNREGGGLHPGFWPGKVMGDIL